MHLASPCTEFCCPLSPTHWRVATRAPLMLMCEHRAVSVGTQPAVASTSCCVCFAAGSFPSRFLTSVVLCILLEIHFVIFCFPVICTFLSYKFFTLRSPQSKPSPSLLPSSVDGTPPTQLCFSSCVLPRIRLATYFCHFCVPNSPQMLLVLPIPSATPLAQLLLSRHRPSPCCPPSTDAPPADPGCSGSAGHRGVAPVVCAPHAQPLPGPGARPELRWPASVCFFP